MGVAAGSYTGQVVSNGITLRAGLTAILSNTVVSSGGMEYIISGGTLSGGQVVSGGTIMIGTGGMAVGGMLMSGGTVSMGGNMAAGQNLSMGGTGDRFVLTSGVNLGASILGFGNSDVLDLLGVAYGSTTQANFTGSTLTVSNGAAAVSLQLGETYTTSNFVLSNDLRGGTLVSWQA